MPKHLTESVNGSITATHTFTTGTCAVSPGGSFKADVISEYTSATGVTIDGVINKDYTMTATGVTVSSYLSRGDGSYERMRYYVSSSEANHGVTGYGSTLKGICETIGTTKKATVVIPHTRADSTTTYAFATSLNLGSYSNIMFEFENGAYFSTSGGITVTLPSPSNIIAGPTQNIFSGSGTYAFSTGGTFRPEWWGVTGVPIQACITAAPTNSTIIMDGDYTIATGLTITSKTHLTIKGNGSITLSAASTTAVIFQLADTCDDIVIEGLELVGEGNSTISDFQGGISAASGQTISNTRFSNLYIHDVNQGIVLNANLSGTWKNAVVENCLIKDIRANATSTAGQGYGIDIATGTYKSSTTVSFTASGGVISDANASYLVDGFAIGDKITITGATATTNCATFNVTGVTGTSMTVNETLSDESVGATVVITCPHEGNVDLIGNTFDDCGRHSIYVGRSKNVRIIGGEIKNHRATVYAAGGISLLPALQIARSANVTVDGVHFQNCYGMATGIMGDSDSVCENIKITNCNYDRFIQHGIAIGNMNGNANTTNEIPKNVFIANNQFRPDPVNGGVSIWFFYGHGVDIVNNLIGIPDDTYADNMVGIAFGYSAAGATPHNYTDTVVCKNNRIYLDASSGEKGISIASCFLTGTCKMNISGNDVPYAATNISMGTTLATNYNMTVRATSYNYVFGTTGAGCSTASTGGYVKTTNDIVFTIGGNRIVQGKDATDDFWDLTSETTGSGEYKKALLCIASSSGLPGHYIVGPTAAASVSAQLPKLPNPDWVPVGVVVFDQNHAGASPLTTFYDLVGPYMQE
ncbi:MAG: right-handed parallel beta-helix repeat-containing protein [Candidatus Paceibacterota bacterium]